MSRLLVVSNRLPVTVRTDHGRAVIVPSVGGLATALGASRDDERVWIGWPGDVARLPAAEAASVDATLSAQNLVPVHLTASEVAHYYDGFSNGVLWPLLHYLLDLVRLDAQRDWNVYRDVNRRFAQKIAEQWRPGDIVWIHDYQLALVPAMLRALVPQARIGFFLHVPFPSAEVFRILPWRRELLEGMLGSDVVGFQTPGYCANFSEAAERVLGARRMRHALALGTRRVRVAAHPISVDYREFDAMARSSEVVAELESLRAGARGKKIVLGVDRLDYTKGIPRRLMAFDRFLERKQQWRDRVLFVQLAVPSREKVDAYSELRRTVNELVGRINGQHGKATSAPLQLLYRALSREDVVSLYRAADVMLVTPLRDGMNLVAKEYVASRVDEDGVLVLSEFAGAAAELEEAMIVNPYDLDELSRAVAGALEMTPREKRARMRALRKKVAARDIHTWIERFLSDLTPDATLARVDDATA